MCFGANLDRGCVLMLSQATGNNGAVGGTVSSYMSVCHNIHVPREADIVFVEYRCGTGAGTQC